MTRATGLAWLAGLAAAGGAAALAVEVAWVRAGAAILGNDAQAAGAVLTACFVGWGLGARWAGGVREGAVLTRISQLNFVGAVVVVLSLSALKAAAWLVPRMAPADAGAAHTAVAFGVTMLLLAPAAACFGAVVPLLLRQARVVWPAEAGAVGLILGADTAGGAAGVALASLVALERFGARATLLGAALALVAVAAVARLTAGRMPEPDPDRGIAAERGTDSGLALTVVFVAALAGVSFQLGALRVFSLVTNASVYGFGLVALAHLGGSALGSLVAVGAARFRGVDSRRLGGPVMAAALGLAVLTLLFATAASWAPSVIGAGALSGDAGVALALGLPPAALTAAVFCFAAPLSQRNAFFVSGLGAAAAPVLAQLVVLPRWGTAGLLRAAVLAMVAVGFFVAVHARRRGLPVVGVFGVLGCSAAACVALALAAGPIPRVQVPASARVVSVREGAGSRIVVEESPSGARRLRSGGHYAEGGEESAFGEARQGHLPMLLHPHPRRVLGIGIGTGVTLGAMARHPGVEVHGVEILGEVLQTLPWFQRANGDLLGRPHVHLHQADARAFVRAWAAQGERFDVVVGDLVHPQREGGGSLYTREHFQAVARVLASGGVFVQWLPLHELPPPALATVLATFLGVFPDAVAMLAYFNARTPALGLVSGPAPWSVDDVAARSAAMRDVLGDTLLDRPGELWGGLVAARPGLLRLAAGGQVATDDRPLVEYQAVRGLAAMRAGETLEHVLSVMGPVDPAEDPVRLALRFAPTVEGLASSHAITQVRLAVAAALRGQIAEARGDGAAAIRAYREGLALDPAFVLNRLLLSRLAPGSP